jgi:DNA-binding NtrC family response regulator
MLTRHVLSIGYDTGLLHTRTLVLRHAGYEVQECTLLTRALSLLESDSPPIVVLCDSIPNIERAWFVKEATNRCPMMRILWIKMHIYDQGAAGCVSIDKDPISLLEALARTPFDGSDSERLAS